ncbi:MAG: HDOD domain-containing protein [Chthoniobacter sp.]|nr:HDOD domain-containing protein [Chthoniobacter sp.]
MKPETLIGKTPNLVVPSPTVARLLHLLSGDDADYDEIVATIGRDLVLTTKLLALCNSAGFALAKPVASLKQAVNYLGYCETLRLVMALNFGAQVEVEIPGYAMEGGALWHHSLVTALLSSQVIGLSRRIALDGSIAYTAGLVHDIGKIVIGHFLDAEMRARVQSLIETSGVSLVAAEKEVIGCDHAEVGACLLRQWRIPEVIAEAVADHHHPPLGKGPRLSAAVHIADVIAHQTGSSPGWGSFAVTAHADALTALNLNNKDLNTLTFAALDAAEKAARPELAPDSEISAAVIAEYAF